MKKNVLAIGLSVLLIVGTVTTAMGASDIPKDSKTETTMEVTESSEEETEESTEAETGETEESTETGSEETTESAEVETEESSESVEDETEESLPQETKETEEEDEDITEGETLESSSTASDVVSKEPLKLNSKLLMEESSEEADECNLNALVFKALESGERKIKLDKQSTYYATEDIVIPQGKRISLELYSGKIVIDMKGYGIIVDGGTLNVVTVRKDSSVHIIGEGAPLFKVQSGLLAINCRGAIYGDILIENGTCRMHPSIGSGNTEIYGKITINAGNVNLDGTKLYIKDGLKAEQNANGDEIEVRLAKINLDGDPVLEVTSLSDDKSTHDKISIVMPTGIYGKESIGADIIVNEITEKFIAGGQFYGEIDERFLIDGNRLIEVEDGIYFVTDIKEGEVRTETAEPEINTENVTVKSPENVTDEEQELVEDTVNTAITEIEENTTVQSDVPKGFDAAFQSEKLAEAIQLQDGAALKLKMGIELQGIETEVNEKEASIKKLSFEITPMYSISLGGISEGEPEKLDNQYLNGKEITFRLPIPSSVSEPYAKVTHKGVNYYDIKGSGTEKYIEVKANSFSPFTVEFALEKPNEDNKPSEDENTDKPSENQNSNNHSGGSYGGGGGTRMGVAYNAVSNLSGTWKQDEIGWWFEKADGSYPVNQWFECEWKGVKNWYHFNAQGYMDTGWFTDIDGRKYFLHNVSDDTLGHMYVGTHLIDGVSYYFNEQHDGYYGALIK